MLSWSGPPAEDTKVNDHVLLKLFSFVFHLFTLWRLNICADLDDSLLFTVAEECPKEAAVEVIQHRDEEQLVKLKGRREL